MECVLWASIKARASSDQDESSDSPWEEEQDWQTEDGILGPEEKDALRTLKLTEEDCGAEALQDTTNSDETMQSAVIDSDSSKLWPGSMIDTLKERLRQLYPGGLQHRQVTHMLHAEKEKRKQEDDFYQRLQLTFPQDIQIMDVEKRCEAARKVFEGDWLRRTEIELTSTRPGQTLSSTPI